ncbi:MAG: helix-turn-helix transcriptional regulator, partial [Candidatus Hodarchaeales archaeon]
ADEFWKKALKIPGLPFEVLISCHESLIRIAFLLWRIDQTDKQFSLLINHLKEFEHLCKSKNVVPSLCKIYLIRSKIASTKLNPKEAKYWIELCKSVSDISGLDLYYSLAEKELEKVKQKIIFPDQNNETDTTTQLKELESYITELNHYIEKLLIKEKKFKKEILQAEKIETKTLNELHENVLEILRTNPLGILQKDLSSMTNLSKRTISDCVRDLLDLNLIQRIPQGRANIVRLKEYFE